MEGRIETEQSLLLMDLVSSIGFSELEISNHRDRTFFAGLCTEIPCLRDRVSFDYAGSYKEGIQGGFYSFLRSDIDVTLFERGLKIKTDDFPAHYYKTKQNLEYGEFSVEEDIDFSGYLKLRYIQGGSEEVLPNVLERNNKKLYLSSRKYFERIFSKRGTPYPHAKTLNTSINGPALTENFFFHTYTPYGYYRSIETDRVCCIRYSAWPHVAKSWLTRERMQWPPKTIIEDIKKEGCFLTPVGHIASSQKDIQWRISFPGERKLTAELNSVQIVCFILLKLVLKNDLKYIIPKGVLSTYTLKNVIYWSVEQYSSSIEWVPNNLIKCLQLCIRKLIMFIESGVLPHFIIENRNMINSKVAENVAKECLAVLRRFSYNPMDILNLNSIAGLVRLKCHDDISCLKKLTNISILISFFANVHILIAELRFNDYFFLVYNISHNIRDTIHAVGSIHDIIVKKKGPSRFLHINYVRSMLGLLYYSHYKIHGEEHILQASKKLIQKSFALDMSHTMLRAATFFFVEGEYGRVNDICNAILDDPPIISDIAHPISDMYTLFKDTNLNFEMYEEMVNEKLIEVRDKLTSIRLKRLKSLSIYRDYRVPSAVPIDPVWQYKNCVNFLLREYIWNVTYGPAEKWAVPDVLQYELLSMSANNREPIWGDACIILDPISCCLLLKFLCSYKNEEHTYTRKILLKLKKHIFKKPNIHKQLYLNMLAYCYIKAEFSLKTVPLILESMTLYPSKYNVAFGYVKLIVGIFLAF